MLKPFTLQAPNSKLALSTLLPLLLTTLISLTGCGGGAPQEAPVEQEVAPPFKAETLKIDQYSKIGNKAAEGGHFIVVTLSLENTSQADLAFSRSDFMIQNITDKKEEQYQQAPEGNLNFEYSRQFGPGSTDKFLGTADTVHPKFKVEKMLIYALPQSQDPAKFELFYTPKKIAFPLVGSSTEVNDHQAP